MNRVWVTGIGAVTPGGWTAEETWRTVRDGRACSQYITRFPLRESPTRVAAHVPGATERVPPDEAYSLHFARVALAEAMGQARMPAEEGVDFLVVASHGERRLPVNGQDPTTMAIADLARDLAKDANAASASGLYGACAASNLAIGAATGLLASGAAETAIAGGADSFIQEVDFFSLVAMHAMTSRDCPPEEACCPFDQRRDGFLPAEGAGFVVLETEAYARARGAEPLAVVEGFGAAQNAYDIVASPPDAVGPWLAIQRALEDARLPADEVDYVNAHGTSTRDNDWCETMAIRKALGPAADRVPVSSSKSEIGHCLGAASVVEAVICIKAMQEGTVPPTINLREPDPVCDLDYVPDEARPRKLRHVLSNGFGFGGQSAALVLGAP